MKQGIRRIVKELYRRMFKPFLKNGVNVNIGGTGRFRFDYIFAFSRFEEFGSKHNAGFSKWLNACRGKRTVLDVGAHIGLYSIPASTVVHKEGLIYAFEPSSANCVYLERHKRFNGIENIKVLSYLVGETASDNTEFYEAKDADAMNSVFVRKNRNNYKKILKKQVSLDEFCIKNRIAPEVLKIDVEGAELGVLKGAKGIFTKYKPVVFLSVHPRTLSLIGQSAEDVLEQIRRLGYSIYGADGNETDIDRHNEYILIQKEKRFNEIFN